MGKGNKDGKNKGGGSGKGGAMGITANMTLSPEQVRKDGKSFASSMGEAALTAATALASTAVMYGLAALSRRACVWFGITNTSVLPAPSAGVEQSSEAGKPSKEDVLAAYEECMGTLDKSVPLSDLINQMLEDNPEWQTHKGMLFGIVKQHVASKN